MPRMTLDTLAQLADRGEIDTVLACLVDMQGRLMGKRFHVRNFLESSHAETHACNYLLATDLEMATPEGYAATSWRHGYGDYVMKPDLSTLRPLPWLEGTVMVICDVLDHHSHEPVPHAPRQVLKAQLARLEKLGFTAKMATELEFFLFADSYDTIRAGGFRSLRPISGYNDDYNIQHTTRIENIMRPIRNHLHAAGIPIENSKGEAETGQEELNIRYDDALLCCDYHTIAKQGVKDIAWQQGVSASFIPKWHRDKVGSAAHIHQSLWTDGKNAFHDPEADMGMSATMRSYMAGLIAHAPETTVFMAPYVNSYKRFVAGTFAPTKTVWSVDNRTAGFRLVGESTKGVRVECRIPGSDINPYLACAAQIASGIAGIEAGLALGDPIRGDVYNAEVPEIPRTLRDATATLRDSEMLRKAMGDAVIDHYVRCAEVEQEDFDSAVTDYEIARGFERA
ncbi:glutamine synthetase family protein [Oceaniglobus trochenteri]|uniref:glutamine synthetase family protein n=1 Tax=Oceaniglobus trochenteri TaxID=2763260 RepID=UPI001CFFB52A|nr:glutamine synthetase family protein [Oceaniglobus trochenteri]